MLNTSRRIGLFDSGVGGLTVLDKLKHLSSTISTPGLSDLDEAGERHFVYLGDTARCPYGNRSPAEIITFVTEITGWLKGKGVDAVVVACNTSASLALETAQQIAEIPVFDLIAPTAEYVARIGRKVGVMATKATSRSEAFSRAIHKVAADVKVVEIPCPDLVPIIEAGEILSDKTTTVLSSYAQLLIREEVEVLVWGCTHFPFLQDAFRGLVSKELVFVDPAEVLCGLLGTREETLVEGKSKSQCQIYVTGDPAEFARTARACLGYLPGTITGITLDEVISANIADEVQFKRSAKAEGSPFAPAV
jgi:glutamate racemase